MKKKKLIAHLMKGPLCWSWLTHASIFSLQLVRLLVFLNMERVVVGAAAAAQERDRAVRRGDLQDRMLFLGRHNHRDHHDLQSDHNPSYGHLAT